MPSLSGEPSAQSATTPSVLTFIPPSLPMLCGGEFQPFQKTAAHGWTFFNGRCRRSSDRCDEADCPAQAVWLVPRCLWTYGVGQDRLLPSNENALTSGNGRYVHPEMDRLCSVREMAALQGFPNDFVFNGAAVSNMYRHIGDAVPPLIAYQMAHLSHWILTASNRVWKRSFFRRRI